MYKSILLTVVGLLVLPMLSHSGKEGVMASVQTKITAKAVLVDALDFEAGTVLFEQAGDRVHITVDAYRLAPGWHALHIHSEGVCEPPSFEAAGSHFNPYRTEHGLLNPKGPHAGDLPNILADGNGYAHMEFDTALVTLEEGAENSLFKPGGTSIVVHQKPDDYVSQPAGGSTGRILCGAIARS